MRVTSLGSGSSGNALLVEAGPRQRTKLLIDAGLPGRLLAERLRQAHIYPAQLSGVLLTHEHSDHVIGLPGLLKQCAPPIFSTPGTLSAIERLSLWDNPATNRDALSEAVIVAPEAASSCNEPETLLHPLSVGTCSIIGDIEVLSFPVSHDAAEPCGYLLSAGGWRVGVVIDSGEVTLAMLDAMQRADLLILEANHDLQRLLRGPYPYHLKQRILSSTGHLSNDQAAEAVLRTWRTDSMRWLWLSHLSRTNNTPRLALKSMVTRLDAANANLSHIHISVLPPAMGHVWDSTQLWHEPSLWEWRG